MRLIDADSLLDNAIKYKIGRTSFEEMIKCVNDQPTAYNLEAVVKEVQNIGTRFCTVSGCNDECECCDHGSIMKSIIDVIRKGGADMRKKVEE